MTVRPTAGFVHIPKTGGTTVKFILRNSTLLRHCDVQPLVRNGIATADDIVFIKKFFFFGLHSIAGHSLRPWVAGMPGSLTFFTLLRDPLQRCLSHYQHVKRARQRQGRDIAFEEFMRIERFIDFQVRHIAGCPDVEKAKDCLKRRFFFVGLCERFDESMLVLQKLFPYPLTLLYRPLHVSRDNAIKQEVLNSSTARELLVAGNRLDMELYAFVRDEFYPALRAQAGVTGCDDTHNSPPPSSRPVRYRLTRFYSHGIYRSANKIRRLVKGRGAAH